MLEGDFYLKLAPQLDVRVPEAVAVVSDRDAQQSVLIMRDLIAAGGRFCSALEAFTADQAADSLEPDRAAARRQRLARRRALDPAARRRARAHAAYDAPRSCRNCSTVRAETT